ncbi:hypothetical protein [Singulisphaera sp. PoT]|uniref:hypothetical protein n=1 Tax=Singulisphaera sp. PoT TaxID=3411797 RepID=UPI003BF46A3E
MTGMRTWQTIAKNSVLLFFGWEVATTLVGLVVLILVATLDGTPSTQSLISVVGTLVLYGVVIWAVRDARRRSRLNPPGSEQTPP